MLRILLINLLVLIVAGCGDSQDNIEESIQRTQDLLIPPCDKHTSANVVFIKKMPQDMYLDLVNTVKENNKIYSPIIYASSNLHNRSYHYPEVTVNAFEPATSLATVVIYDPKYKTPTLQKWNFSSNTWVQSYHK